MNKQAFRIRDRDGLFSSGGYYPSFEKKGKTWSTAGALTSHLSILSEHTLKKYVSRGAEIVTYDVVETESNRETLEQRIAVRKLRESERKAHYKTIQDKWQREQDLAEFARLKEKLGV